MSFYNNKLFKLINKSNEEELTPISKYIFSGVINIPAEEWYKLNSMYDSDTIISYFQDEILNGNIKLPLRDLTENDAMNSFLNLYSYDVGDFEYSKTYSKYEYKLPISDKFIPCGVEGNVASDYFQQENRFYCGSSVAPSPYRLHRATSRTP